MPSDIGGPVEMTHGILRDRIKATRQQGAKASIYIHQIAFDDASPAAPDLMDTVMIDREGNAKIMDFGIARSLGGKGITGAGMMIGTPEYMSPEQAGLGSLDLDTRTDIYSLGVLLYQLLTGTTPVREEALHRAAMDEIRRMIRETEPPKPSTRLQTLGAKLAEVAQQRQTGVDQRRQLARHDHDLLGLQPADVELADAPFLAPGAPFVALARLADVRRKQSDAPNVVDRQSQRLGLQHAEHLFAVFVEVCKDEESFLSKWVLSIFCMDS
jgi:serine/threonine protein kinase